MFPSFFSLRHNKRFFSPFSLRKKTSNKSEYADETACLCLICCWGFFFRFLRSINLFSVVPVQNQVSCYHKAAGIIFFGRSEKL